MKRWQRASVFLVLSGALCLACSDDDTQPTPADAGPDAVASDQGSDTMAPDQAVPTHGWAQIVTGIAHTCGIDLQGKVWCWGDGVNGQLGQGMPASSNIPVEVKDANGASLPGKATWVAAGWGHSCAVLESGQAYCWGSNDVYQLGDGGSDDSASALPVSGLNDAVLISAGGKHTCATRRDQTVWCWGLNAEGTLGDGTMNDKITPHQVPGLSGVVSVDAGIWNTCVSTSAGIGYCWGENTDGQVGDGSDGDVKYSPVQLAGVTGVASVHVGEFHSCARTLTGDAYCWGLNDDGELGTGDTTAQPTPYKLPVSGALGISPGLGYSCVVDGSGQVQCWGANADGQLGNGGTDPSMTPVNVTGLTGASWVGTGDQHACALSGVNAYCWGRNVEGQIGDGTNNAALTPRPVPAPTSM